MEFSTIIALGSLLLAIIAAYKAGNKDTRGDAAREARTETKLDNIINGVAEIRLDMRTMNDRLSKHETRITRAEGDIQDQKRRIDELEKFVHQAHPPA